ncbi:MAG: CBS domain-containing protein [Myxococcales bacterium]|nr:CBS domain-containing protein [Myxococcales bacterium]
MTPFPHAISPQASIAEAQEMMQAHGIRHLPVCEQHTVIGILSERDTRVALRVDSQGRSLTVGEVCTQSPYIVGLDTPLDEVAAEMAARQIGSALVMRGDKLAGILTTTDVCRLLAQTLRECFENEDDVVA